SDLRSAAHSLALLSTGGYPEEQAWEEARDALREISLVATATPLQKWLDDTCKVQRGEMWLQQRHVLPMATFLLDLAADFGLEVAKYQALLIPPDRRMDYLNPLFRFGKSI